MNFKKGLLIASLNVVLSGYINWVSNKKKVLFLVDRSAKKKPLPKPPSVQQTLETFFYLKITGNIF